MPSSSKSLALNADLFFTRLHALLLTPKGQTSLLHTTSYTLSLLHAHLTYLLTKRYESLALALTTDLAPGDLLTATIKPAPHLRLATTCARVKALQTVVEDVRLSLRLTGLLSIYTEAKEAYLHPKRDPAIKILHWAKLGCTALYQLFENIAYLSQRGVINDSNSRKLWAWSAKFWMARTVLELLRLWRVRSLRYNEEFGAERQGQVKVQSAELEKRWWRELYASLGWLSWSLAAREQDAEDLNVGREAWCALSGLVPGVVALQNAWRDIGK